MDLMRSARQAAQQGSCLIGIGRFAKNITIDNHIGVGAEHNGLRLPAQLEQAGACFFTGDTIHILLRAFPNLKLLVYRGINSFEADTQLGQQFLSSRRLGSQINHADAVKL
jgi:hypothetical protein